MEVQHSKKKPLLVFGTRHGCIFNITPSHLVTLPAVQLSVGDFYDSKQALESLPKEMSFKKFIGLPQQVKTYLSPYDFYKKQVFTGCEKQTVVKIKCNKGYTQFKAQTYDQIVKLIKPDYLVTLTEYPASQKGHSSQSNKSHKRAITKTSSYLQKSQLVESKHEGTKILAAIHGAKNLSLISRSLEQILNYKVDGFVICDLCQKQTLSERQEIYNTILKRLDSGDEKQKSFEMALAGMGKIQDIIHGMKFGITIFEVNYPFFLAEKQKALIKNEDNTYSQHQPVLKKDLDPLDKKCSCYACQRHSESYIAHLISCFELNAKVLLSIHNLQIYIDFINSF